MTTATFAVEGLTCGSCLAEVMEELRVLDGVTGVAVDLIKDGRSPVVLTSEMALGAVQVREAVRRAGFVMAGPDRWELNCTHEASPRLLTARVNHLTNDNSAVEV
jgi:copper chaperone